MEEDEKTFVAPLCPACRHREGLLHDPRLQGVTVTTIVICGRGDDLPAFTVMARRGENITAIERGHTAEDALHDVLVALGIIA